jgi:hypothetical protein
LIFLTGKKFWNSANIGLVVATAPPINNTCEDSTVKKLIPALNNSIARVFSLVGKV